MSKYTADFKPIPAAAEDVREFQKVLIDPRMGGFAESDVKVLIDPQKKEMETEIYRLFTNRQKDDLVLLYFSGHGVKEVTRIGSKFYFCTTETTLDKGELFSPSAVEARYLQDYMNKSKSERQVIILDCCFSGAFSDGLEAKSGGAIDIEAQLGTKGRAILTSSTSTQESLTHKESKLSIYTSYLVEGIVKGAAEQDNDGWILADKLHKYASKKVGEAAPAMTPQFYPVKEGYGIRLAKALVAADSPELKYRKIAQKLSKNGTFTNMGLLNVWQSRLKLTPEVAKKIQYEVLQPYKEFQDKLKEYEEALQHSLSPDKTLSEEEIEVLQLYQQELGLTDENVAEINQKITGSSFLKSGKPGVTSSASSLAKFTFDILTVNATGKEANRRRGEAEYFTADLGNGVTLDMVSIPGGQFLMGSPEKELERSGDESPQHQVTVKPFFMGKFPVTQAQWSAVASLPKINHDLELDPSNFKGIHRPVERVSWFHTVEFCQRLSQKLGREYRLPTEAEWEYACRAGTTTPFHFGETINTDLANYDGDNVYGSGTKGKYRKETTDVGSFGVANAFGLYDMHGNVWEWCIDHYHDNYKGARIDGSAWLIDGEESDNHYRLLRGGSWDGNPGNCRCAYRDWLAPALMDDGIGFRLACSPARTP